MKHLYVAGQDPNTREWIPVAELREAEGGYQLLYTQGAHRLPNFGGLSRMQALDKVYYSSTLFPFFANRLISKSRPEYRQYLHWLGLESLPTTPLQELAITGGIRATDKYELVAPPRRLGETLHLVFFPRGLRYQPPQFVSQLRELSEGSSLYLLKDVQNAKDLKALAIRTEHPHAMLVGYVPRYYCAGLSNLLDRSSAEVKAQIKRVNGDAPLDMKLLVSIEATAPAGFDVFAGIQDLQPINTTKFEVLPAEALSRTHLDF